MLRFILDRIIKGSFVLGGVVIAVFCLFYVLPGDPVRMGGGQHPDSLTLAAIRVELGLDQPTSIQFLSYINDLSPISIHDPNDKDSPFYLDTNDYSPYIEIYQFGEPAKEQHDLNQ